MYPHSVFLLGCLLEWRNELSHLKLKCSFGIVCPVAYEQCGWDAVYLSLSLTTISVGFTSLTYPHTCTLCKTGCENQAVKTIGTALEFQAFRSRSHCVTGCDTTNFSLFSWKFRSQHKQNFNLVLQFWMAAHLYSSILLLSLSSMIHRRFGQSWCWE